MVLVTAWGSALRPTWGKAKAMVTVKVKVKALVMMKVKVKALVMVKQRPLQRPGQLLAR
jgi:hypothetical protein